MHRLLTLGAPSAKLQILDILGLSTDYLALGAPSIYNLNVRKFNFVIGNYYHIYNRGTDKRIIFKNKLDLQRFIESMASFNTLEPIGSILENRYKKKEGSVNLEANPKLVDIICYCLSPNHYHFILSPLVENGIEKFMQKLGAGYTMFFNSKYERNGVLFQGRFKAIHINSDEYLMYLNVYVNLNDRAHSLGAPSAKWIGKSSWGEYIGENNENFCNKSIVLERFNSGMEYKEFAEETLKGIVEMKERLKEYLLEG